MDFFSRNLILGGGFIFQWMGGLFIGGGTCFDVGDSKNSWSGGGGLMLLIRGNPDVIVGMGWSEASKSIKGDDGPC